MPPSPLTAATRLSASVTSARPPADSSTNRAADSIFGPMLPAGKSPSSRPRADVVGAVIWESVRSQRVPKSSDTCGTPVSSTSTSARMSTASRSEQRSLSITPATPVTATPSIGDRDPAAAAGDHDGPVLDQRDHVVLAEDLDADAGWGRRAASRGRRPARRPSRTSSARRLRLRLVVERADRLGRVRERVIGRVHEHAREQHGGRDPRIERGERALQQVADLALCHRDQGVQWQRRGLALAGGFWSSSAPTCGPLPCVSTISWPAARSASTARAISRTFASCSGQVPA